jgi:hypothetical protein
LTSLPDEDDYSHDGGVLRTLWKRAVVTACPLGLGTEKGKMEAEIFLNLGKIPPYFSGDIKFNKNIYQ